MKKNYLLLILLSSSLGVFAQKIVIKDHDGNTVNGMVYTVKQDGNGIDTASLSVALADTFTSAKEVVVTRKELNVCPESKNFFCWALCYQPVQSGSKPVWTAADAFTMQPDTTYEDQFHAYHQPEGGTGDALYRFIWKIKGDADTFFVDIKFEVEGTCYESVAKKSSSVALSVSPNPVLNNLTINGMEQYKGNKTFAVYDILGNKLISQNTSRNMLDVSYLPRGIYILRIYHEATELKSIKFLKN